MQVSLCQNKWFKETLYLSIPTLQKGWMTLFFSLLDYCQIARDLAQVAGNISWAFFFFFFKNISLTHERRALGAKFSEFPSCQLSNLPPSCKVSRCFILLKGKQMKGLGSQEPCPDWQLLAAGGSGSDRCSLWRWARSNHPPYCGRTDCCTGESTEIFCLFVSWHLFQQNLKILYWGRWCFLTDHNHLSIFRVPSLL